MSTSKYPAAAPPSMDSPPHAFTAAMYRASTLGALWPTRYTPGYSGRSAPVRSRCLISAIVIPASSSSPRVATPFDPWAIRARISSTVLDFGRTTTTSPDGSDTPPADGYNPPPMVKPRVDTLLERTDSAYAAVIVAAKRARQLNSYYRALGEGTYEEYTPPMVESRTGNYLTISLEELAQGKINYRYRV